MPYDEGQLARLLVSLRRPHVANRDRIWDERRNARHRKTKPIMPRGLDITQLLSDEFDYRTVLPEFSIAVMKGKMGSSEPHLAVKMRGQQPKREALGEKVEEWFRGVMSALLQDDVDGDLRDGQAGTGIIWAELEFKPSYVPPARGEYGEVDYDEAVEDGRMAYGLPACMSVIDSRGVYWSPISKPENPKIVAKVVNIELHEIENAYSQQGFKIAYEANGDKGRFVKQPAIILGDAMPPVAQSNDHSRIVRVVVIADSEYIYHLMFPAEGQQNVSGIGVHEFGDPSANYVPQLTLLATYPNPIGRPPFFSCYGRKTDDPDPGYRFKPLAVEVLDMAPMINTMATGRLHRGILDMYKPPYYKSQATQQPSQTGAPQQTNPIDWRPDKPLVGTGEWLDIPSPDLKNLDQMSAELKEEYNSYSRDLRQSMQQGAIGRSTPSWSIMQINEEEIGLVSDAQNSRANLYRDALLCVAKACMKKYAKGGPVYVVASTKDKKNPGSHIEDMIGVTAQELEQFFKVGRLEVTIAAERQSQKAASTEYWRLLRQEGTLSQETYEERIGIQDRVAEQARKDMEAIGQPMRQLAINLGWELFKEQARVAYGPIVDLVLGMTGIGQMQAAQLAAAPMEGEMPPEGEGMRPEASPRLPGMGLGLTPPRLGGRVLAGPTGMQGVA